MRCLDDQTHSQFPAQSRRVGVFATLYFVAYLRYLWAFNSLENEWTHWLTLVLMPAVGTWSLLGGKLHSTGIRVCLSYCGLEYRKSKQGIGWSALVGVGLGLLQLALSRHRNVILDYVSSGKALYAFPMAFLLMMCTAGFTEEFFFRGVLQRGLTDLTGSRIIGLAGSSVLFGLYHLPYAYLNPAWPSHGNLLQAFTEGVIPSTVIGFVFGVVYAKFRNLLAPVILHACFNAVWAMTLF